MAKVRYPLQTPDSTTEFTKLRSNNNESPYSLGFPLGLTDTAVAVTGDATYYYVSAGLTACGTRHSDSELIAAIGFPYWTTPNPNVDPNYRKTAWVKDPTTGKSLTIRIVDKCASCGRNNIDLSLAAFERFRNRTVGRFRVDWGIN